MAFKVKVADQQRVATGFGELTTERGRLEDEVRTFNEALAVARAVLLSAVESYNAKLNEVRDVVEDIHSELQEEFESKSDNWQNGDKGSVVQEWLSEIETFYTSLEEADISSFPETLEFEEVLSTDDPEEMFSELDKEPTE